MREVEPKTTVERNARNFSKAHMKMEENKITGTPQRKSSSSFNLTVFPTIEDNHYFNLGKPKYSNPFVYPTLFCVVAVVFRSPADEKTNKPNAKNDLLGGRNNDQLSVFI